MSIARWFIEAIFDPEPVKKDSWGGNQMHYFFHFDEFHRSDALSMLVYLGFLIDFFRHLDHPWLTVPLKIFSSKIEENKSFALGPIQFHIRIVNMFLVSARKA